MNLQAPDPKTLTTEAPLRACAKFIEAEMAWLSRVIDARLHSYFHPEDSPTEIVPPPPVAADPSSYAALLQKQEMGLPERLVLALAIAPSMKPALLDVLRVKKTTTGEAFTEFGGVQGTRHLGFLPTGETALFLLAGGDLERRCAVLPLFAPDHFFYRENVLTPQEAATHEPPWSVPLSLTPSFLRSLITGEEPKPAYSVSFPARRITTRLAWEDLILERTVMAGVEEILAWGQHGATVQEQWGLGKRLKPGLCTLFHGPPGTGKTLTACLLGQALGREVYRIDLSQVVSKYLGETEKNLDRVLGAANEKNWILFFDEADALFGKRSEVRDSHDRFANIEISYLLQRLEDFPGIVILATSHKANLDAAFLRRLRFYIEFPMPEAAERWRLWQSTFPPDVAFEKGVELREIAREHPLTGGQIVDVVRHCALMSLERGEKVIRHEYLLRGIRQEMAKEGRDVAAVAGALREAVATTV